MKNKRKNGMEKLKKMQWGKSEVSKRKVRRKAKR